MGSRLLCSMSPITNWHKNRLQFSSAIVVSALCFDGIDFFANKFVFSVFSKKPRSREGRKSQISGQLYNTSDADQWGRLLKRRSKYFWKDAASYSMVWRCLANVEVRCWVHHRQRIKEQCSTIWKGIDTVSRPEFRYCNSSIKRASCCPSAGWN